MLDPPPAGTDAAKPPVLTSGRGILASAAILGGTTILVKLAAFAKDWLVARSLGASDELDAFLVALLLPSFAVAVLAQSLATALLPSYVRVWERQGAAAAARLAGGALLFGAAGLALVCLLMVALAPLLLSWIGMGFDSAKLSLAVSLFYVLCAILFVSGISSILGVVLNAHEHFGITAAAPLAVPIATLTAFWFFQDRYGVHALAAGTLLGFVLECCILAVALHRLGLLSGPRWTPRDAALRHVANQYVPLVVAAGLMSSSLVVDQSMAASLGSGNVSVLSYANKLVVFILNLVAVSLSTVLFPRFSKLITGGHWNQLEHLLRTTIVWLLLISIPAIALLALASEGLVRLLFERGAFTPETTAQVAAVQIWYLPQIPFYVLVMLGHRLLSALESGHILLRIGALNLVLNVAGNYGLMHLFGVRGIAMSTSLVYFVATLATLAAIRIKLAEARSKPA